MSFIASAAIGAGASIFGSIMQSNSANAARNQEMQMFNTANSALSPYYTAGAKMLPTLEGLITPGANQTELLKQTPGFQFLSDWGQKGIANQGTTTGLGGNTLAAGANFASNLALSQAWQPTVNSLQNLVNTGAGAAGSLMGGAVGAGGNIGNAIMGGGNALAAGGIGAGNNIMQAMLMNKLFGGAAGGGSQYGLGGGNTWGPEGGGI